MSIAVRLRAPRRPFLKALAVALCATLLGALLVVLPLPGRAQAAVFENFDAVYSVNTNGNILIAANTLMTCVDSAQCRAAQAEATGASASMMSNNDFNSRFVDVDGVANTFNSSSAGLTVPAGGAVLYAALVWGGRTGMTATTNADPARRGQVVLTAPGGTRHELTGRVAAETSGAERGYQGYVDVTDLVSAAGSGSYTLANVQSLSGGTNQFAGWALAVVVADPNAPARNLTVFKGFGSVSANNPQSFTVSGFLTPPAGPVRTTLGAVTYEGDRGYAGDAFQLNGVALSDAVNGANNAFNSTIAVNGSLVTAGRTPAYNNQLGFDADLFSVDGRLANSATSATFTLTSSQDQYFPGLVTFATDLYDPKLYTDKYVDHVDVDGDGALNIGDRLKYTIDVKNIGLDTASNSRLFDAIPTGTTYVPGSLALNGVSQTDAESDDRADYVPSAGDGNGAIVARVGTGASSLDGGDIGMFDQSGQHELITFEVVVDRAVDGQEIVNVASLGYRGRTTLAFSSSASNDVVSPVRAVPAGANQPPLAPDHVVSITPTAETAAIDIPVLSSVTDPESGSVRVVAVTDASGGVVTIQPDGAVRYTPAPGFAGRDAFTYTVEDDAGNLSTGTIRVDVVNAAPVAVDDAITVSRSAPTPLNLLGNDSDGNQDALSVRSITGPGGTATGTGTITTARGGSVSLGTDGTVTYTPPAGGLTIGQTDSFSYVVQDARGGSDDAVVTVTARNLAPTATADSVRTDIGASLSISPLANDVDPDADALTITAVGAPGHGTAAIGPNGTITYAPAAGYVGTDSFTYTIRDPAGLTSTATITVTVNGPPVATADSRVIAGGATVTLNVLANDTDPNNDQLTLVSIAAPEHGDLTFAPDGTVTYTPDAGFVGTETLAYTAGDGSLTSTSSLTITVQNVAPSTSPMTASTSTGTAVTVDVLAGVTDANVAAGLQTLTVSAPIASAGSAVVNTDGTLTVTPPAGYKGSITVSYTVDDGAGGSVAGTLTVQVANGIPVALPDTASTDTDTAVDIDVLANDTDDNGDTLTIQSAAQPTDETSTVRGVTQIVDGKVQFTPAAGFAGTVTFEYSVSDGDGGIATATATVTVRNSVPVAAADTATTATNTPVTIDVTANDTDANTAQTLAVVSATADNGATATIDEDGRVTVTPAAGFRGTVTVNYVVSDGAGGTAAATVTVTVSNAPPVATNDASSVANRGTTVIDVLGNDTDLNGDPLTIATVGAPLDASGNPQGTARLVDGRIAYDAPGGFAGTVTIAYTITDGAGGTATGTVTITVEAPATIAPAPADQSTNSEGTQGQGEGNGTTQSTAEGNVATRLARSGSDFSPLGASIAVMMLILGAGLVTFDRISRRRRFSSH